MSFHSLLILDLVEIVRDIIEVVQKTKKQIITSSFYLTRMSTYKLNSVVTSDITLSPDNAISQHPSSGSQSHR